MARRGSPKWMRQQAAKAAKKKNKPILVRAKLRPGQILHAAITETGMNAPTLVPSSTKTKSPARTTRRAATTAKKPAKKRKTISSKKPPAKSAKPIARKKTVRKRAPPKATQRPSLHTPALIQPFSAHEKQSSNLPLGMKEGDRSHLRQLPHQPLGRAAWSSADKSMNRAVDARTAALHPPQGKFARLEAKREKLAARKTKQEQKLTQLKLKRQRAEAGVEYAKSRMWGLRQLWTKFWKGRVSRLDRRIARTEQRIAALAKLSAVVEAKFEQRKKDYLAQHQTNQANARATLANEREFMQRNMAEQQTRMVRDVNGLKQNRLVFLELKERDPAINERISRIEKNIPRIENAGRAIRFEICYRSMWGELYRGNYSEALGWLSEMEKLTIPPQE